jgi:hypothetical protein
MKLNALTSVALIVALGLFTACGSEEAPKDGSDTTGESTDAGATDGTDTNTTDTNTTDNNTTDDNTDIGGTGNTGNDSANDCTQAGSGDACYQCFAQQDAAGYQAYVGQIVNNCLCANECEAECANECADPSTLAEGACNTCFNGVTGDQDSACITGFSTGCQADNTCITFAMNVQGCPQ